MSIALYDKTVHECNAIITKRYSTSFTLGIRLLGKKYQMAVYSIYGFVRVADEIVDTFHDHDKAALLNEFEKDTWLAFERGISVNPVIHSFIQTAHRFSIDKHLIQSFLDSMRMDLEGKRYDAGSYQQYIYGSAEVVGLMCLKIFCDGNETRYNELVPSARSLGAALQKVNFLRDLKDDFSERGRIYFPGVCMDEFNSECKAGIESDIQKDFDHALEGIKKLPDGCRIGVYIAYRYYIKLFRRIKESIPQRLMNERVRINNASKLSILLRSVARYQLNML